jgi:hypothetical protein
LRRFDQVQRFEEITECDASLNSVTGGSFHDLHDVQLRPGHQRWAPTAPSVPRRPEHPENLCFPRAVSICCPQHRRLKLCSAVHLIHDLGDQGVRSLSSQRTPQEQS